MTLLFYRLSVFDMGIKMFYLEVLKDINFKAARGIDDSK